MTAKKKVPPAGPKTLPKTATPRAGRHGGPSALPPKIRAILARTAAARAELDAAIEIARRS